MFIFHNKIRNKKQREILSTTYKFCTQKRRKIIIMKVNELKKLLEKCDGKKAMEIISLINKKLPKSAKEELDNKIIALINNIKIEKVKKEEKSFESLSNEINEFIQNAYDRNYEWE